MARIGEYHSAPDASAAAWVTAGLRGFAESVLSVVPAGFPAYGRVFHPAWRDRPERPVRWRDVARANGRTAHPAMQWPSIAGWAPQPGIWDREPDEGTLPPLLLPVLTAVLARHTRTPGRCWFAAWAGYGAVPPDAVPSFAIPHREFALLTGPVSAARTSLGSGPDWQSPSLWWPDDRAWCVATEVDLMSTYLGGTADCVAGLAAAAELEATAVLPADGVTWASDRLNPPP